MLGSLLMPVALIAFSASRTVPLAFGALVVVGVGLTFFNNANATVQMLADDTLRGRVVSVYSLMFFGLVPLGSLAMGAAALFVCAAAVHVAYPALPEIGRYKAKKGTRLWRVPFAVRLVAREGFEPSTFGL